MEMDEPFGTWLASLADMAAAYTADGAMKVMVRAQVQSTYTGLLKVSLYSYIDAPTLTKQNGEAIDKTAVISTGSNTPPTAISTQFRILTNPETVLRSADQGSIQLSINPTVSLVANAGKMEASLKAGLVSVTITAPGALRCLWINGNTNYLASACSWTPDTLVITAPKLNAISSGTAWKVKAMVIMQATTFAYATSPAPGWHKATVSLKSDGTTVDGYAESPLYLAPILATVFTALSYNNAISSPTGLFLSLKPITTVPAALETSAGSSDLVISFDSSIMGANLGSSDVSLTDETGNFGVTDCADFGTFGANVKCYLRRALNGVTSVWVRNYASLGTSLSKLLLAPIYNPIDEGKIVHVSVFVRQWNAGAWNHLHYAKFGYLYQTAAGVTSVAGGLTIGVNTVQSAATTLSFTLPSLGTAPTELNTGLMMFSLSQKLPDLATITMTTHTLKIMQKHRMLLVVPTAAITAPVDFAGFTPTIYSISQTWTGYLFSNEHLTQVYTYSASIVATTLGTPTFTQVSTLAVPGPFAKNRSNSFAVVFKPLKITPKGGEIRVTFPALFSTKDANCEILGGLWGACACDLSGDGLYYKISGYEEYTPPTLAIALRFTLKTVAIVPAAAVSLGITTYGLAGDTTTSIETVSSSLGSIGAATVPDLLTVSAPTWVQARAQATYGQYTQPLFRLTPRATYAYKASIKLTLTDSTFIPAAAGSALMCIFGISGNWIPSEGGCSATGAVITATVPEQASFSSGTAFTLQVTVRDTGTLANDGLKLPTEAAAATLPVPSASYWLLDVYGTDGTTRVESAKVLSKLPGPAFTSITARFGTVFSNSKTYFDLKITPAAAMLATGVLSIDFPTHNELDTVFLPSLGNQIAAIHIQTRELI